MKFKKLFFLPTLFFIVQVISAQEDSNDLPVLYRFLSNAFFKDSYAATFKNLTKNDIDIYWSFSYYDKKNKTHINNFFTEKTTVIPNHEFDIEFPISRLINLFQEREYYLSIIGVKDSNSKAGFQIIELNNQPTERNKCVTITKYCPENNEFLVEINKYDRKKED